MPTEEHNLQIRLVQYLRLRHFIVIDTDIMDGLKYITGRYKRDTDNLRYAFIAHHKRMGYVKGQPDMIAMKDGKVYCLELKSQKGKQSKEQKEYQKLCMENNIPYVVVRDVEDLIKAIGE